MHVCVPRMLSQTSSTPRKAARRGTKLKSRSPSDFCRICTSSFGIHREYISTYTVMWHNSSVENLHSITCFRILHPNSSPLSSENKLLFCFANQQKHVLFVDKVMEGFLSSFISFVSFNIHTFAFLLPFCRVDISDFPQNQSAKLQRLSTKECEQQPLSVHLWVKKCWNFC